MRRLRVHLVIASHPRIDIGTPNGEQSGETMTSGYQTVRYGRWGAVGGASPGDRATVCTTDNGGRNCCVLDPPPPGPAPGKRPAPAHRSAAFPRACKPRWV